MSFWKKPLKPFERAVKRTRRELLIEARGLELPDFDALLGEMIVDRLNIMERLAITLDELTELASSLWMKGGKR